MSMQKFKAISTFLIASFILLGFCSSKAYATESIDFPALPAVSIPAAPKIAAKSYLLLDYLSNSVLAEQDINARLEPASLTKMMTVYVVDQAIKGNKIKLTDTLQIGERAWRTMGSRMFLDLNSTVSVEDLLRGIIIQSGNDASVAIAEYIAGSEANFAELMNYFAKQLGMQDTHFVNATGLPAPDHYTTAKDMGILARAIIRDFPETYKLYSQKEFIYKNIKQPNRNRLLWRNDWVDGIKTGHTDNAGFCLVASGQKEGMRLIAIVMGAKSDKLRTEEANQLLTYGFQFYETRKLYPANTEVQKARIWMGAEKTLRLGPAQDIYVTIGKGQYDLLKANITVDKIMKAPMQEGTELGKITVQLDDKTIAEQPVIALETIAPAGIFARLYDSIALNLYALWEKVRT